MRYYRTTALVVFVLFVYVFAPLTSANSLSDMVEDDWAYHAIVELGRGRSIPDLVIPPEMTRYQAALMVSRLLQHIDSEEPSGYRRFGMSREVVLDEMITKYNQRVPGDQKLTVAQVELLYRLVLEFRSELEVLGYAIQDYAILMGENESWRLGGLFADRKLTYSEQALAAVRSSSPALMKLTNGERATDTESSTSKSSEKTETEEEPAPELSQIETPTVDTASRAGQEPRSLWVGDFPTQSLLPLASTIAAEEEGKSDGMEVGTVFSLGGLELSSKVRAVPQETESLEFFPAALDVSVGLENSVLVSAGYKPIHDLNKEEDEDSGSSAVTSLGLELPITGGRLRLGMSSEWPRERGDVPNDEEIDESVKEGNILSAKNTAELGFSYEFENDSSLQFNYRLIDFSTVNPSHGATAEFSIKF